MAESFENRETWTFDVTVHVPDPNSTSGYRRKNGLVVASHEGAEAGNLFFGVGPGDTVRITSMETFEPFQCRGCASQMRQALDDAFPELELIDGGSTNSEVGDIVLNKWRERGELGDV